MTNGEIVTAFMKAIEVKDYDTALGYVTDDVEYDNVPMSKMHGPDAIRETLAGFLAGFEEVDWVVHRQAAEGDLVLNERTDRFKMGGKWVEFPVAGVFELRDGRIALWRDYFDLASCMGQLG